MAWFHSLLTSGGGPEIEEGDFDNSSSNVIPVQMQDYDILTAYLKEPSVSLSGYQSIFQSSLKPGNIVSAQTKWITSVYEGFGSDPAASSSKHAGAFLDDNPAVLKSSYSIATGTWHYIAIKF